MYYTVGEMAKRLRIAPSALRYYDKEGLLPFVERSEGGIRVFKDSDYEWLLIIECLKKTGMPLKEIRDFINMAMAGFDSVDKRLDFINTQKNAVEKQIADLTEIHKVLVYKKWYYEKVKEDGHEFVPHNLPVEDIPEELREICNKIRGNIIIE